LTDQPSIVLDVRGLTKRFGSFTAVDGLSLTVRRGDLYGFLGPNGAGKTTTIRTVLGLVRPTGGTIRLLDTPPGKRYHRAVARVGSLIERPAFFDSMSGRTNLLAFGRLMGGGAVGRIDTVLEQVGLTAAAGRPARVYSQGMRQRLGIALALLRDPELLILDEPTNGLDPEGQAEVLDLLRRLASEQGVTVFVSSHQIEEIERFCTRAAILSQGRLLAEDAVSELVKDRRSRLLLRCTDTARAAALLEQQPWVHEVGRGESDHALLVQIEGDRGPEVARLLVEADIGVEEMTWPRQTLREFFMGLTSAPSSAEA
jgi:ABC-2 type transport system ATP-binding protein